MSSFPYHIIKFNIFFNFLQLEDSYNSKKKSFNVLIFDMIIKNNINSNLNFGTKIKLKDLDKVYPKTKNNFTTTYLDTMFNENKLVSILNGFSVFMTQNILCKFFREPQTRSEKLLAKINYKLITICRKLADRVFLMQNLKGIKKIENLFDRFNKNQELYSKELANVGNSIKNKFILINSEDKSLEKITKSKNSTIFVLNHPDYNKDKFIYFIINSILNRLYIAQNKREIPQNTILVSKNMLNIINEHSKSIYQKLGLIPIDASLKNKDKKFNSAIIKPIFKNFTKNKTNIFIFPEGNNSPLTKLPLEKRIQNGIGKLIKKAVNNKSNVTVIPISISYTKNKNNMGNVFIGKPIYFKRKNNEIIFTDGLRNKKIKHMDYNESSEKITNLIAQNLSFGIEEAKKLK